MSLISAEQMLRGRAAAPEASLCCAVHVAEHAIEQQGRSSR